MEPRVTVRAGPVGIGSGCFGCLFVVIGVMFVAVMIIVIGSIATSVRY
jgi:predicted phage tail protein